jgi:hypothetical protein
MRCHMAFRWGAGNRETRCCGACSESWALGRRCRALGKRRLEIEAGRRRELSIEKRTVKWLEDSNATKKASAALAAAVRRARAAARCFIIEMKFKEVICIVMSTRSCQPPPSRASPSLLPPPSHLNATHACECITHPRFQCLFACTCLQPPFLFSPAASSSSLHWQLCSRPATLLQVLPRSGGLTSPPPLRVPTTGSPYTRRCAMFCCCCCRFFSFLRQCQIQRCKVLQPMLPVLSHAQWCSSQQKLQQRYDAAKLSILAQRFDHGENLGGGWSSVCNMSLLQPCNQPPRSTLSLCPWCMRLASASIRSLPAHTLTHLTLPYALHV